MAELLPINYPQAPPKAIASYNWTDLAESTGYVIYYGFDNEADEYSLTQNSGLYSKTAKISKGGAGTDSDEDFDITYSNPQIIEGKLYVGITYYVESFNNENVDAELKVKIIHYDGSTETVIGTEQTSDNIAITLTGSEARRTTFSFDIANTKFKAGETLRVNVVLVPNGSSASGTNCGYYFDPVNRNIDGHLLDVGDSVTAPSKLQV